MIVVGDTGTYADYITIPLKVLIDQWFHNEIYRDLQNTLLCILIHQFLETYNTHYTVLLH